LSSYCKGNGPIKPPTFDTSNITVNARGVAELIDAFDPNLFQEAQEVIAHWHAPVARSSAISAAAGGGGAGIQTWRGVYESARVERAAATADENRGQIIVRMTI
jgi:hypothetical protein